MKTDKIELLVSKQAIMGYNPGNLKSEYIAMLGLMGESGEVLEEWFKPQFPYKNVFGPAVDDFIKKSRLLDDLKKKVRDGKTFHIDPVLPEKEKLIAELADQFYYLLAASTMQGVTLNHLAELSLKKIEQKSKS